MTFIAEEANYWLKDRSESGVRIREDVRAAARIIWRRACEATERAMGDRADAGALIEQAAKEASQYIDRLSVTDTSVNPSAVLMRIFRRLLTRHAARFRRLEPQGREIESLVSVPSWEDRVVQQLFLEKLASAVDEEGVTILWLRLAGCKWDELAEMLHTTIPAAKSRFWREIENAKAKLGIRQKTTGHPRPKAGE